MVEALSRVGGRPGAADGQVDTWVLVRTDKWYSSEKAWPIRSFVTRAYAGSIDRDLSLDTTNAEFSTERCAVECRLDHVVHKQSFGLCCECNVQLGHESMEKVLSCVFPVERCKTCCVDARNVGNFVGHEICGGSIWMMDASK